MRLLLHRFGITGCVHQAQWRATAGRHLRHLTVKTQSGDIIDPIDARLQRGRRHRRFARIN